MALKNSYKAMLGFIDGWLEHRDKLAKLEHQSRLHPQSVPEELAEAIEEEKNEIARLDTDIVSAAEGIVRSPLSLLDDRLSLACRKYLQHARESIARDGTVDDCGDCAKAYDLLKLERPCALGDRVVFYLFLAEELSDKGRRDEANRLIDDSLVQLPSDDHELRAVTYLTRGSQERTYFEARHAYTEALGQLTILIDQANQANYRKKAKSFQALQVSIEKRLSGLREEAAFYAGPKNGGAASASSSSVPKGPSPILPGDLQAEKLPELPPEIPSKITPFRPRRIPVFGEIAAGKEIANPDDVVGYIQQTAGLEFEFSGRPLEPKPLGKSRITFSQEYDYFAVQVSGDSMDRADISSGDYVVVRRTKAPGQGDIVAVVFRDEDDNRATLKRIVIESNKITLRPESSNPKHEARFLPPEAFAGDNPSVAIVGVAIAVLKSHPLKTP